MARSSKDDPIYTDMQHHWSYRPDGTEKCVSKAVGDRNTVPSSSSAALINENKLYTGRNSYTNNDLYVNSFNMNDNAGDGSAPFANNIQNYTPLNIGNGQLVRVYYDENNRQYMIPVSDEYESFQSPGVHESPSATENSTSSHIYNNNQEFSKNGSPSTKPIPNTNHTTNINMQNGTSSFLSEVLGNWVPNSTGTYSPFGQNYPLNHPDAPTMNVHPTTNPFPEVLNPIHKPEIIGPKRNENSPLADTTKKRIVAEVKPMRPSYSDVLAKNTKNTQSESASNLKSSANDVKNSNKTMKPDKINTKLNEEKLKDKKNNTISSGSESGDVMFEETKSTKKNRSKRNMTRKWSSLDDITNEDDTYNDETSQFILIDDQSRKKEKKSGKKQNKSIFNEEDFFDEFDDSNTFSYPEGHIEGVKARRRKDSRNINYKNVKVVPDKKKTQQKSRKTKPAYLEMVQNYLEHWANVTWKAITWFLYLLSDICRMTMHLSCDLFISMFTQTYVSLQAVWRSTKEKISDTLNNRFLLFIDEKLGHTRFGFWRKLKWFKARDKESDKSNVSAKLNANIPLPATGEEAMKRLLACKGKDPYSILGVSVTCTDEDIKRHYKRQAFLVHPDKNQQPGAEEAFKILQHAFHLIGEPDRREAYERRALESRNVEAAWSELGSLLAQLHIKMEIAANTIRCTNCGRRHKRVVTERPCYAARFCAQCKIRHSAKEGDIWAESSMMGLLVMYYACMDGAVYQITQWASCQKKNLKQLRPDCHIVQYRIVLGSKAAQPDFTNKTQCNHDPNLEEFLNSLYSKSKPPASDPNDGKVKRRNKKCKAYAH